VKLLREAIRKLLLEWSIENDFEDVLQTARLAHLGQKRRDGSDYIMHPQAVMGITKAYYPYNYTAQILALLHDTIEDGPANGIPEREIKEIIRGSISDPRELERIEVALDLMTHDKSVYPVYEDYLARVFSNPLAAIVKVSDLIHNLSHNPSEKQIIKYKSALKRVPIPASVDTMHKRKLEGILNANS
jgi:(p)ppGpp synthase/HD superfamily hydrolase